MKKVEEVWVNCMFCGRTYIAEVGKDPGYCGHPECLKLMNQDKALFTDELETKQVLHKPKAKAKNISKGKRNAKEVD